MLKVIRELTPLALIVAAVGAVIAVLLAAGSNLGNWLLAMFLIAHGWVHIMYVMPRPQSTAASSGRAEWAFDLNYSWLAGNVPAMRALGLGLVSLTVVGYALAGLASIPLLVPVDLWAALVVASSLLGGLLVILFFNRMLIIGLVVDVLLLAAVLFTGWRPV